MVMASSIADTNDPRPPIPPRSPKNTAPMTATPLATPNCCVVVRIPAAARAAEDFQLPRILAALADPNRLAAVRFVARNGESWCGQVMDQAMLPMTKSTFSHHLRILREAGVLTKRIQGARGYTSLRKDDLDRRFPGLIDSIVDAATEPVPQPR
jgi:DNA-binding transcriptional ArsR family regulator